MFNDIDLFEQLKKVRQKDRRQEEELLSEAKKILRRDLFTEKKILDNLKQYARSFEVLDEEDLDGDNIFSVEEIKKVAIQHRLKFLESKFYQPEIPYEAILKIKFLDDKFAKELKHFMVLSAPDSFSSKSSDRQSSLFAKTNFDNYYLIHKWGKPLSWKRKIIFRPFRTFESLAITVMIFTFILTMSLPTHLITLDSKATYWCGYRAATFFHLMFFDVGVTVYFAFAFGFNFNSSIWNKRKDFD